MALSREALNNLIDLDGAVLDPVPAEKTDDYRFWRCSHLGRIALNFNQGNYTLNAGEVAGAGSIAHFFNRHSDAKTYGRLTLAHPELALRQYTQEDHRQLKVLLGLQDQDYTPPVLVHALDKSFTESTSLIYKPHISLMADEDLFKDIFLRGPSALSHGSGHITQTPLTTEIIDEFSRAELTEIFDLNA
jgi:hypothetical protein